MTMDLKNDHPEFADRVLAGEMTADEARTRIIMRQALAAITENMPELLDNLDIRRGMSRRKFDRSASELERFLVVLLDFDGERHLEG